MKYIQDGFKKLTTLHYIIFVLSAIVGFLFATTARLNNENIRNINDISKMKAVIIQQGSKINDLEEALNGVIDTLESQGEN